MSTISVDNLEELVEKTLSKMTLEEKVSLFSGLDNWYTVEIQRLGIPALVMTDGPHGVRADASNLNRKMSPATSFPTGVSFASTWDPDLIEEVGAALGEETKEMGCDILLGPCVNIVRGPLAGRNFESYSEDPYLAGVIGSAWVKGLQSKGVGASLKHFACNNQEINRHRGSSEVDERTLREIYLPAFERIVKETQPWTVMHSYNKINGVYACDHEFLMTEILRNEWGFDGVIVSDWGATHSTIESKIAGLDIEMPGPAKFYGKLLTEAVNHWQVEQEFVDESVRRMLRMIYKVKAPAAGLKPGGKLNSTDHQNLACRVAESAITLLINDGNVLPLNKKTIKTLAVLGPNSATPNIGGGGSSYLEPPYAVSPLEGLRKYLGDAVEIIHEDGCQHVNDSNDPLRIQKAADLARKADAAVVFIGMPKGFESEGDDRKDMMLPGSQDQLVKEVLKANPNSVVVLVCGSPIEMPWVEDVHALILAYYPGQEGGNALANVLFGEVNPSGKLSVTYPVKLKDTPAYINYPGTQEVFYGEGIFVGYRYYEYKDVQPLFPFGHGLSYTPFKLDDLTLPATFTPGEDMVVSCSITNTGNRQGSEVVQIYVGDLSASLARPLKELKGFQKISLQPGEKKTLNFKLNDRAFSFYNPYEFGWVTEPGEFEISLGTSSKNILLKKAITVK